ncbi:methyltransferase [Salix suchowensis]|nr:methyltransferase [Salix suchowensis]
MAKPNPLKHPLLKYFISILLVSLSYILGIYNNSNNSTSPPLQEQKQPLNCHKLNFSLSVLDFESHHTLPLPQEPLKNLQFFNFCPPNFTNYCPCHDPSRETDFTAERFFSRERHCPEPYEKPQCLVPRPDAYKRPFHGQRAGTTLGDSLVFPDGGTSFRKGVKGYVDEIKRFVPLRSGSIRTVLDVGCGVASFGAHLMDYNILTMSLAPSDKHEAQVQLALERGVPAISFDMAHCARCLVQWTNYDGLYLMEIDRVLRPGGYWVFSGPPINWKATYKGSEVGAQELEQARLEDLAVRLCWKKVAEKGAIAVWRKPNNHIHCIIKSRIWKSAQFVLTAILMLVGEYKKMEPCITPLLNVTDIHDISGDSLEKWPKRLNIAPPRTKIEGISGAAFKEDNQLWKRRVRYYGIILKSLTKGRYRNIMDMNAGIGGFAAALTQYPVWVMNVLPYDAKQNNLSIVFDRGLIGTYMNWCEAFSTYPRTYDLIHAHGVFSMYMDKCSILDILLEMHRILRPEGAVIIRDHVDTIVAVKGIAEKMRWNGRVLHSENGAFHPEKIL